VKYELNIYILFRRNSVFKEFSTAPCRPGRTITQAAIPRLPAAEAWVRFHITLCAICGRKMALVADFFRVLRFPLLIIGPTTAPYSLIIQSWMEVSGKLHGPADLPPGDITPVPIG
jgi:hypothetical protein